ncbi:type II secretion system F family protein [Patescibacteria group bacterium]
MKFNYIAITKEGERTKGVAEAKDKFDLARQLKSNNKTLVSADEANDKGVFDLTAINAFLSKVKTQEKIIFARNMAAMLEAGLSLARSLTILERQTKNEKFKKTIRAVGEDVGKGNTLHAALAKFPKIFPSMFVAMVSAGEESGGLAGSLRIVSEQMEKSYLMTKKIKGALLYPSIIVIAMIIVGVLMLMFVVPTLTSTFVELGVELPASTKAIIIVSDFLANYKLLVLPVAIIIVALITMFFKTPRGKRILDFSFLHIPVIGVLVKETNSARTARTLSSLLAAGVDIMDALEITGSVMQNSYYKEVIAKSRERIQKGDPLSASFKEAEHLYPILVGEIMEVGEETGKISDMMLEIATFYEGEVELATKNMTTIIEPFLMLIVGAVVGFFAIAMITPMYSMMEGI